MVLALLLLQQTVYEFGNSLRNPEVRVKLVPNLGRMTRINETMQELYAKRRMNKKKGVCREFESTE